MSAQSIRAIIVDDEQAARETLLLYIQKYCEGVEVIGEAADVPSAIETISKLKPSLVFLDVEMPFGNAFDVLENTATLGFETIFITAFSEYAIKAFNFSAAYYILKPVDIGELVHAVNKVKLQLSMNQQPLISQTLFDNMRHPENRKLVLPTASGFEIVSVKEIIRLSGSSNYTEIFLTDGKKKVVSKVLKFFEEMLNDQGFMRVHKSHIINLEQIKKYHKGRGGSVELSDGSEIEISPNKKQELLAYFG
ncbi:MAG: LytTR family DNA-binding domain-containing protein [Bacteroidota bacterium]|nr:LytTR family DNA-binding domain-containing protein [Bacteroidota bacterium]